jgi:hypothetical protein
MIFWTASDMDLRSLGWVGRLIVVPFVPSLRVLSAWYPLYQTWYHGYRRILSRDHGGFIHMASPSNPVMAPAVTYEYVFCLRTVEWLVLATRSIEGLGATVGVTAKILDTTGSL